MSSCSPPMRHTCLEILLIQLGKELFTDNLDAPSKSNLPVEKWKALRNFAWDHSIAIKVADKGSPVFVWETTY